MSESDWWLLHLRFICVFGRARMPTLVNVLDIDVVAMVRDRALDMVQRARIFLQKLRIHI